MNRLNGWQRIWVVLMVVWALSVLFLASADPPRFHGLDFSVSQQMPTRAWWGSDCAGHELKAGERAFRGGRTNEWTGERWRVVQPSEIAAELRRDHPASYAGLSDEQVMKRVDDFAKSLGGEAVTDSYVQHIKAKVPQLDTNVVLCFDTRIRDAEMNRILTEFSTGYRAAWWRAVASRVIIGMLFWLVPGIALYAFGWSIAWVWRGFRNAAG